MLSSSFLNMRYAHGIWLILLIAAPTIWGQEAKAPAAAAPAAAQAETPAAAPSPSDVTTNEAKPDASAPKVRVPRSRGPKSPAAKETADKNVPAPIAYDYSRLAHPNVAAQLELNDEQRAAIARIINDRATKLATSSDAQRKKVVAAADQQLAAVLNGDQLAKLATMTEEQKLRFNFREQNWADVLDWFARQADLALVMDKAPPGAFTYTNNRSYSPKEAIDLLNSVLLTKGFTLLQRGRMLILADLTDDLPTNLIPRVAPDEIGQHGDFEIIMVQFPLAGRPADRVVQEIQPLIGSYGECVGLPQTGQLLVTETAGKMQAISILISSIPTPKPPEKKKEKPEKPEPPPPVLAVYPVEHVKPAAAVETLSILFPGGKFTVDDKSDQVMAFARPHEQTGIKLAVEQMESNRPLDKQPRLEVYPLDLPDSEQLVEQLQAALPEVQIAMDTTLGRLLVFAPPEIQESVKGMIEKLGATVDAGAKQVVVYRPKHFDPTTLASLIQKLAPRAEVETDAALRRVVVSTGPAHQTMIKSLVEQLDKESALEDQPLLQVYSLEKSADPSLVTNLKAIVPTATVTLSKDGRQVSVVARVVDQTVVKKMVDRWVELASTQQEPELKIYPLAEPLSTTELATLKSLVPTAQATLSKDSRQLTVIAHTTDQEAVQTLLQRFAEATAALPKQELKVYPLAEPFASADVASLTALVPGAKITLATDGRHLRVMALADEHQELEERIKQIAAAAAAEIKPELAVIALSKPLNPSVLSTVQSLVPGAKVTVSTDKKELIVVARADELAVIKKTLDQISVSAESAQDQQLEFYQLKGLPAAELSKLLQALVVHSTITIDAAQDRLIVWGPAAEHAAFAEVISKLEQNPLVGTRPVLKFYPLADQQQFTGISAVLKSLVPAAKLTWDADARRAMVIATPKDHQAVQETIEQVLEDAGPIEERVLQLYALTSAQQTRFQAVQADVLLDMPAVRVIADPQTGELAVWAKASEHKKLSDLFESLKATGDSAEKRFLIGYSIDSGSPETAFEMLQELFPNAKFTLDAKSGRILAHATLSEQGSIKQTVEQLDVEGAPSNREELRSYSTGDSNPTPFVKMLQKLVPDMQLTPDVASRKLIAWGSQRDHEVLGKAVEQIRTGDPTDQPIIRAYPMEGREVRSLIYMRSVLLEVVPDAAITIDPTGGSIVASATEEDHVKLKEAIDEIVRLDAKASFQLETYPLDKLTATQVIQSLRPIVPAAEVSAGSDPRQLVVWATPEDHERVKAALAKLEEAAGGDSERILQLHRVRPAVAAQAGRFIGRSLPGLQVLTGQGSDRLLVWGTPKDQQQLATLIKQMDDELGFDVKREMKTYELDDVDPLEARRVLDSAIGNLEYVAGSDPAKIVVWADAAAHTQVTELLEELKQAIGKPHQVLRVHQFDDDETDVATVHAALAPEDIKDLTIQVNTETNSLIVRGPADRQVALAETLVDLVAQLPTVQKPEAVVYRLNQANPTAASLLIRSLLPGRPVAVDVAGRTVAVTATAKDQAKVKEVLDQLDNKDGGDLVTETYVMKRGNPTAVMTALRPIVPRATLSADIYNKMLIVTATAEDHEQIKAIVERADGEGAGELTTKAYPLKYANAFTITSSLAKVVPAASVSPDSVNKMLVVTANAEDHKRIMAVLEQADMRGGGGELETKAYALQLANASTISVAVRAVIPNAIVSPDVVNKMLVVTASKEDHQRVRAIVDEADRRNEGDITTEVYALKFANAMSLAYSIKAIAPQATASPDVYNKTVVVTATPNDHERIKTIIDQADKRGGGNLLTKAYSVKWANPTTIATALRAVVPSATLSSDVVNKMLIVTANQEDHDKIQEVLDQADQRGGGGELVTHAYALQTANPSTIMLALRPVVPNATVSADTVNKMLIVTASEEDHKKITAVVDEADHRADGEFVTQVYNLKWANPMALSYSIRPVAKNATVSPDVYNKTLIVTATAKDHERIKAVVEQADKRGGGEQLTKAYPVEWANPTTIATALATVVPNAKLSSDVVNKMLIVTANAEDHTKIQEVLTQADQRGGGGELVTHAYALQTANPSTIMLALRPVVPNATVSADTVNKMLIVTASEEDHKKITAVVDEADHRADGELVTQVYNLKWANPMALSLSIRPIAKNATVSPDVYNKTLIVTATEKDHVRIKAVVEQADKRGGGDLLTKAYALKWANPTTITTALTAVVPAANISSDRTNKMLVVTANQEDHDKIQEVLEQADKRGGGDLVTKAYTLRRANPTTIMVALRPVVPDATVSADTLNRVLIVTASDEDHTRVQTIVDAADGVGDGKVVTEAYSLKWANPRTLYTALAPIVPSATISADTTNKTLIVTATETDHLLVKKVVEQADRRGDGKMTTEVYLLTRANPIYVSRALTPLVPDATIGADAVSKTLIVTAPEAEQEKIKKIVERADRRGEGELLTKVYPFKLANPTTAATALKTLIPNAQMSADASTNTLIVTGTVEDHEQVEPLVKDMDVPSPNTRVLKPYNVTNADAREVYTSLTQLFRYNREVSVGFQEETGMILVFAPGVDQQEVENAILEIEKATAARPKATLQVYQLDGLDGDAALDTLESLLEDETPTIDLELDGTNNQILAIAEPDQQERISEALSRLEPVEREMEVFTLERVDPVTAESAIATLFADLPFAAMPSVEADPDTQQLIVRGTKAQLAKISQLLEKMGEGSVKSPQRKSNSMLRVIPLSGNTEDVLREIEKLWPKVRGNEIQIMTPPADSRRRSLRPNTPPTDTTLPRTQNSPARPTNPATTNPATTNPATGPAEEPASVDTTLPKHASAMRTVPALLVSAQVEEARTAVPTVKPDVEPVTGLSVGPAGAVPVTPQRAPALPPVVVIASEGSVTIASQDIEALNQFEELLIMLQRGKRRSFENGNFSMFILQNADAKELAEVLNSLFRRDSRSSRGSSRSYTQRRSTNLTVVADERMNALLVYGSMADRATVEEMLDVLDSTDIPDSLTTERPRMIPVKNLPAGSVLNVLQSVYKTQLATRRGLRPVTIPLGISSEMTTMLELLNATANAPILTLDSDETTNSIVMRAPRQLGEEIEEFIVELDEQAQGGGTRNISLVPLKGMNSEQVQDALELLMRGGRYRRSSSSSYRGR